MRVALLGFRGENAMVGAACSGDEVTLVMTASVVVPSLRDSVAARCSFPGLPPLRLRSGQALGYQRTSPSTSLMPSSAGLKKNLVHFRKKKGQQLRCPLQTENR
jgi:hypothetical protein